MKVIIDIIKRLVSHYNKNPVATAHLGIGVMAIALATMNLMGGDTAMSTGRWSSLYIFTKIIFGHHGWAIFQYIVGVCFVVWSLVKI